MGKVLGAEREGGGGVGGWTGKTLRSGKRRGRGGGRSAGDEEVEARGWGEGSDGDEGAGCIGHVLGGQAMEDVGRSVIVEEVDCASRKRYDRILILSVFCFMEPSVSPYSALSIVGGPRYYILV